MARVDLQQRSIALSTVVDMLSLAILTLTRSQWLSNSKIVDPAKGLLSVHYLILSSIERLVPSLAMLQVIIRLLARP